MAGTADRLHGRSFSNIHSNEIIWNFFLVKHVRNFFFDLLTMNIGSTNVSKIKSASSLALHEHNVSIVVTQNASKLE